MGTHDDSNSDENEGKRRRVAASRTQSIDEVLEHRYERLYGDEEVENRTEEGQAIRVPIPDPAYHNLKTQLLKNIVKHDDLAEAVGSLDFKNRHGNERMLESHDADFVTPDGELPPPDDALPSFGRKFSVNDL